MKRKKVCIIGLGFVGSVMSVATAISKKNGKYNFDVTCLDQNNLVGKNKIKKFNEGTYEFNCNDKNLLNNYNKHLFKVKNLKASDNLNVINDSEIIIISISCDITNLDNAKEKLNLFLSSSKKILNYVNEDSLVLFETTLPPGTIEKKILPIVKNIFRKKKYMKEPKIAYSYERVMPGENYLNSIICIEFIWYNNISKKLCKSFLSSIINTKKFPLREYETTTEVELSKIIENSYRAINIAMISDWLNFSIKNNLDLNRILEGIRIRDSHNNIRYTGLGMGGYCLTKDPMFSLISSKYIFKQDDKFPFSNMALKKRKELNSISLNYIKSKVDNFFLKRDKILILGLSYKNNVGDLRFSSAQEIARKLKKKYKRVFYQDNFISTYNFLQRSTLKKLNEFKILIFLINHDYYKKLPLSNLKNKIIIDLSHTFNLKQINKIKKYNNYFKFGSK